MKLLLKLLFGSIFVFMLIVTVRCWPVSLWSARPLFAANRWATATLYDVTFGFLTFFCLASRERSRSAKILRFVLIMAPENITMSFYVLRRLFGWRPDEPGSARFGQKAA